MGPLYTEPEKTSLAHCLWMNEYWFKSFFLEKGGRTVENPTINITTEGKGKKQACKFHSAIVVAKDAVVNREDGRQDQVVYAFFIYFEGSVWKEKSTENVAELLAAIKKREAINEYEDKLEDRKYRERARRKKTRAIKGIKFTNFKATA